MNIIGEKIQIFDTTLRDGDQGAGCSFTMSEKILIAEALTKTGVDIIEAGFAASRVDNSISEIAKTIGKGEKSPTITSLSRAVESDIDASFEALKNATNPRIHTFFPTSDKHLLTRFSGKYKTDNLEKIKKLALIDIEKTVKYAKKTGMQIQWSAEDATNSDLNFLILACNTAIKAGAEIINLPDTLGYITPEKIKFMFEKVYKKTWENKMDGKNFIFATHNHNDLGLASINSLNAILGGARQIETTVLGIGERAGNAKFHEIIALLNANNIPHNINNSQVASLSHLISNILGREIPKNEPIIGGFVNMHGSGIHADGAKKATDKGETDIYNKQTFNYGVRPSEEMFFARGGVKQIADFLKCWGVNFDNFNTDKEIYDYLNKNNIVSKSASISEKTRGLYKSNIFAIYQTFLGNFDIISLKALSRKKVEFKLNINKKEINFSGEAVGENGLVNATTNAINNYLGEKNFISVDKIEVNQRASINKLRGDFKLNLDKKGEVGSEQLGITYIKLKTKSGEKIRVKYCHNDTTEATIKAIITGSAKFLLQK